jgi:chromosome segregation ATPase
VSGATAMLTPDQHSSLVEKAVQDSTAVLTAEKAALEERVSAIESERSQLTDALQKAESKLDVLAAEKSAAETAAQAAQAELATFKAELQHAAEVEALKGERAARVKAANGSLPEDFYSDERLTRWAEMATEQFDAFVVDISAVATAAAAAGDAAGTVTQQARQTAAFTGGSTADAPKASGPGTGLKQLFAAQRRVTTA